MPDLSVIVPSVNGLRDLTPCMEALARQRVEVDLEAVVVDRLGEHVRSEVRSRFPWARVIDVPSNTTIPEMRAIGIWASEGRAVAIIEDHVLVRAGWARQLLVALGKGAEVVGGAVENAATDTLTDWAAFLCEYSHCLPPLEEGEVEWLTGNNVAYTRDLLERHRGIIDEHRWEGHLHDAIRAAGTPLVCRPEIVVDHKKHFTVAEYLYLRYQYSRSYAGSLTRDVAFPRRLLLGLASAALPPLLFYRTVSRILSKGRYRDYLVRSLPLLGLFVIVWAWGEVVGHVAGPGDSLSKVT